MLMWIKRFTCILAASLVMTNLNVYGAELPKNIEGVDKLYPKEWTVES